MFKSAICSLLLTLLYGCSSIPTPHQRGQLADDLAATIGWQAKSIRTSFFQLRSYQPKALSTKQLTIYIEGDGLAWISRHQPSMNPTPVEAMGLQLAVSVAATDSAYLARPCQFVQDKRCQQTYWTSARFSEAVIISMDQAVSQLKQQSGATQLVLIGYSGGGAVAALLAARRDDVSRLITVAGNLDHAFWAKEQGVTPLYDSLNPADQWQSLRSVEQVHFVGGQDQVVPLSVARAYQQQFPSRHRPSIELVDDADHHCCWPELWPELLSTIEKK